ncbi:MAG: hypothetical protein J6J01_06410 [Oscillospiraceae bacterium]|nr:hypothetical protein [Oscillospiraceae bacterium]
MDKIPWNRVILDEYVSLALLTEEEENIIRTRAAGWSQVKQCHTFSMSPAALARKIKKLKIKYDALIPYSDKLPADIDF